MPIVGDRTSAAERADDPGGWRMPLSTREALYEVVGARRDIRRFRPDPIPSEVVRRVLTSAHSAPSVGHSQSWRFVVVQSDETRQRATVIAERERLRQTRLLTDDAARRMRDLQLDGIREAPVGIVVCCDRRVDPAGVLGRATFPDADMWSCACAIQNLWLAARAEGLGVGWVTLFPPAELAGLVGVPDGVETLGWLCVGWPDERPPEPGLQRAGWSSRLPLDSVVISEHWDGARGPARPQSHLAPPAQSDVVAARDESDTLLTPPGSLGTLDRVLDRLGAVGVAPGQGAASGPGADSSGAEQAPAGPGLGRSPAGTLVLAGADHPVARLGVSTFPPEVTREVLEATVAGESIGAASAAAVHLGVVAVDAGVDGEPVAGAEVCRPAGTRGSLADGDALERADVERLIDFGRRLGAERVASPLVAVGEVGVGNTTVASALAALLLGLDPAKAVGLGAGGDSATVRRKIEVVSSALRRVGRAAHGTKDPVGALAAVGGPELAVLAGVVLGVASRRGAVVLDGYATSVAALCALRMEPAVAAHLVAGQQSREKGHQVVLDELGLEPLLDLRLRAGEGVGAVFATQLILSALATRRRAGRTG